MRNQLDAFAHRNAGRTVGRMRRARRLPSYSNLYEQVRALFFLYAIYRFHLPTRGPASYRRLRRLQRPATAALRRPSTALAAPLSDTASAWPRPTTNSPSDAG
ncbi:MAG: hypothetical protein R2838_24095 [Caldilineaceae bacterium]